MNEETKDKIESYVCRWREGIRENMRVDINFGYSLAEAEITRLKTLIEKAWSLDATQMTWEKFKNENNL